MTIDPCIFDEEDLMSVKLSVSDELKRRTVDAARSQAMKECAFLRGLFIKACQPLHDAIKSKEADETDILNLQGLQAEIAVRGEEELSFNVPRWCNRILIRSAKKTYRERSDLVRLILASQLK